MPRRCARPPNRSSSSCRARPCFPAGAGCGFPRARRNCTTRWNWCSPWAGEAPTWGPEAADAAIESLALGLDLTARDLQAEAKKKGAPWARSKGFAGAAPISPLQDATAFRGRWGEIDLRCTVEGTLRQQATCAEMIHDPPAVVALLSRWFLLEPGDLIFTGTPAGVGPIRPGQRATAVSRALGEELRVEVT
ncbi:MAG: fumarylacetoacetate hydrolase family protein [Acidobacteriota bacterium]|nr:fumarylacetoacetate hydrolase family protein [Acidobacteriota bacterium]